MTGERIKNLGERVEQLSEKQREASQKEFASRWSLLSGEEQAVVREVMREFGRLHDTGQMTTEEQTQKWYDSLPTEKLEVMSKAWPDWDEP